MCNLILNFLMKGFVLILASSFFGCDYYESRNFKLAYEQNNCIEARKILLNTLKKDFNKYAPKFNLIHTYVCEGDLLLAVKQATALLADDVDHKFELYFIKAYLLGEMGEIAEALSNYQKALDIKSDKRVQQNMELLLKGSGAGKSGKNKKGKGKKNDKSQSDENSDGEESDPERKDQGSSKDDSSNKDPKNEQSKKMSQQQIQKIMKEIDGDEKKIRSQGLKIKSKKGNESSGKNW